jgi:uncharacterized repeat protein (TIGR04076 family)
LEVRQMKKVKVTVVSQQGHCAYGHAVGHEWICDSLTPGGMCASAYIAIYPTIRALAAGGTFPWANKDGSLDLACPDHANPLVLRLAAID